MFDSGLIAKKIAPTLPLRLYYPLPQVVNYPYFTPQEVNHISITPTRGNPHAAQGLLTARRQKVLTNSVARVTLSPSFTWAALRLTAPFPRCIVFIREWFWVGFG